MAHIDTLKRTKILATVGPAVDDPVMMEKIIRSGVNACRINFSHGTEEQRVKEISTIRDISHRLGRHVAILQDLQGPKIRFGEIQGNHYDIHEGDELGLTYGIEHDGSNNLPSQYDLSDKCVPGDNIFLFDGKIRTVVDRIEGKTVWVKVMNPGFIMSHKAINLPDMRGGAAPVLTDKDMADLLWGLDKDIDYTALSFVHHADDVRKLRHIIREHGSDRPIIIKLETRTGADPANLEDIVKEADGMMVARGDLAVEAGYEIVPIVQRRIIELCQKYGKLCIVATQMMGSMVSNPEPSRAEVSDVATAYLEGADAVMLSDETAMGQYPVEAVTAMNKTLHYTQDHHDVYDLYQRNGIDERTDSIAKSAVMLANESNADAILAETNDGLMVRNLSIHRPTMPVLAVATTERLANRMGLLYNVRGFIGQLGEGEKLLQDLVNRDFFGKDTAKVVVVQGEQIKLVELHK